MVSSVEKVRKAIKYASYPPIGERSLGGGQCHKLWSEDYRDSANENIMFVAQIESPTGVDIVEELALQALVMPKDKKAKGQIFGGWMVS